LQAVSYAVSGPGPFAFFAVAVVAIILIASWVILAGSRFVQGGIVERPERVPQLYGYTVCLIAVVAAFASAISLVENGLALANPTYSAEDEWADWSQPSVTSFEAFRATYDRARELRAGPNAPAPEPIAEPELRRRYEALRADRIDRVRIRAQRSLVTSTLTLAIAIALFAIHWRWLRRRVEAARMTS
jgi:hypothetical protein